MSDTVYMEYCADCKSLARILARANDTDVEDEYRDIYSRFHGGDPL